jgi:hypothetical protein
VPYNDDDDDDDNNNNISMPNIVKRTIHKDT